MISKKAFKAFGRKKYLAAAIPLIMAAQAQGFEFFMGEMEGSLDSQISMGSSWRTEGQNAGLIKGIDGADTNAQNNNDGDLNYDNGDSFSQIFKGSHDLQVSYGNYGAFVRGKYWYDAALEDDSALDDSNNHDLAKYSGAEVLDAFVYGEFEVLNMPLDVRLGKQVVSWGESTFILGGVNQINPIDVSSFRRPGAEIKEGLIPVNMAFASLGLTENLSAEAFYQLGFQETVISSCGTFFATNDYAPEGCGPVETAAGNISRADDRVPDSDGQFGIAFRYFSESLDTEFGFYAMNIHSRVPLVGGTKAVIDEMAFLTANPTDPTDMTDPIAVAAATYAGAKNNAGAAAVTGTNEFVGFDMFASWSDIESAAATPADPRNGTALDLVNEHGASVAVGALAGMTTNAALLGGVNPNYLIEYPEDQQIAGISFATTLGGIALSGEITHKLDVPFQINSTQLLGAVLQADAIKNLVIAGAIQNGDIPSTITEEQALAIPAVRDAVVAKMDNSFMVEAALGADGESLPGFKTFDVTQVQVTAIQLIDQVLGASRFAIVAEAGYTYAHEFDENDALKFDGNGDLKDTVTESSWGYRARIIGQYNDVFSGVNLSPVLSWSHDVEGVAPAPGGNFIEDEKVLGFTLNAEYQNMYTAAISYTQYSGGETNSLVDRDFASISVGMQF